MNQSKQYPKPTNEHIIPPQHIMIKTTLFSISAAVAMIGMAQASLVTLSGVGRNGPVVMTSGGSTVANGLIRVGQLTGDPADATIAAIDAVFEEFGTDNTSGTGLAGATVSNPAGTPFNNNQIYVWIFENDNSDPGQEHGLFSVADPNAPDSGPNWFFPVHTGTGTDGVTVQWAAVLNDGSTQWTPGAGFDPAGNGSLILAPVIPEPSSALLAGLVGAFFAFRRRR